MYGGLLLLGPAREWDVGKHAQGRLHFPALRGGGGLC